MKKKKCCVHCKEVKEEMFLNMETNKIPFKQMKEESVPSC